MSGTVETHAETKPARPEIQDKLKSMSLEYLDRRRKNNIALERRFEILLDAYKGQAHLNSLLSSSVAELESRLKETETRLERIAGWVNKQVGK